jgi:hydroxyethylthiazole kinase-like uncharacterized protein yjeF
MPAEPLTAEVVARWLPARPPDAHKGTFGTLVVVAGSLDYAGAALLVCAAATRAGAGLVTLAVPRSLQPIFAGRVMEATTLGLLEAEAQAGDPAAEVALTAIEARAPAALVVGPGLRESDAYLELIRSLLARPGAPMIVDGGALNLLARSGSWWRDIRRDCVLTPHPGEFARLTGAAVGTSDDERADRCARAATDFGAVVLLKGARSVICAPDGRSARLPFATAALATAGSGDVLAGTIGALLAQSVAPYEAACLGGWLHGQAGTLVAQRLGESGVVAGDLPYQIALARAELATMNRPL